MLELTGDKGPFTKIFEGTCSICKSNIRIQVVTHKESDDEEENTRICEKCWKKEYLCEWW